MVQQTLNDKKSVKKKETKKKSVKKKSVKKSAKKSNSSIEITIRRKIGNQAPVENHFVLHDGKKLKSIIDMVDEFKDMSIDVFNHHVNEGRNDFANWVDDVFKDKELAEELRRSNDIMEAELRSLRKIVKDIMK